MTWREIAAEQRRAAFKLFGDKNDVCPRAACSRAYYAVYALLASKAPKGMTYPHGWNNPSHDQIGEIVRSLKHPNRRDLREAVDRLRSSRTTADYGVGQAVGVNEARERLRDCANAFELLNA